MSQSSFDPLSLIDGHAPSTVTPARTVLVGPFEDALSRVKKAPGTPGNRGLAHFVHSLVEGQEVNLLAVEQLPNGDAGLWAELFDYFLDGMTEDDRQAIAQAFEPYAAMQTPGARH